MNKIFITSTLHHDWNLDFNPKICRALEQKNILCHLPQRDTNQSGTPEEKFTQNFEGIKNSSKLLAIAKNESINWGVEVGFAGGLNKKIVTLSEKGHDLPLMARGVVTKQIVVDDINKISAYIDELAEALF